MNREHVDAEGSLHRRQLEDLVHHDLRAGVTLQGDFNAGVICGEITHSRDIEKDLLANQFGNPNLESCPVHAMGNLPDDDLGGTGFTLGHLHDPAHLNTATTGSKITVDALVAANFAR